MIVGSAQNDVQITRLEGIERRSAEGNGRPSCADVGIGFAFAAGTFEGAFDAFKATREGGRDVEARVKPLEGRDEGHTIIGKGLGRFKEGQEVNFKVVTLSRRWGG